MLLRTRPRGLRVKIIAWSFIPTTIILFAVALVTFNAYQQVTEDLVLGRNQELTRLSAGQLGSDLSEYAEILTALARTEDIQGSDRFLQQAALRRASNRLVVFDAGVVILNGYGAVVAAEPARPGDLGQDWSRRGYFRQMLRSAGPVFSDIVADGPGGSDVIVVAVPITGSQGEFRGTMAGLFRLGATAVSAFYGGIVKLRLGESGSTYIVDASGRVIYHSDSTRIGEDFSSRDVVRRALGGRAEEHLARDTDGRDIVATFAPVARTPWVLVNEESWAALMSSSEGYRRSLLVLLALGLVVPALVVTVGVRRITGPIAELIGGAQEVAAGSFGRTIAVRTGDELEELAKQFNLMSAQLQESYADLERKVSARTRELATINAIAAVVSRSLELEEILGDALDRTLQAMETETGGIYLLEKDGELLNLAVHRGISPEHSGRLQKLRVGEGYSGRVAEMGEPVVVKDISVDPWLARLLASDPGHLSLASVPLVSKAKVLGALFAIRERREFSGQEVQLLSSIGHQIGVAVDNARLYRSAQQLAVVEERTRLARDLHDSVTQAVYSVTLYAEASARLLTAGDVPTAVEHLRELRSTAQQALREMRSLIFELRPSVLEKEGLVAALQARLEAVEMRAGLATEFKAEGDGTLPTPVEDGLYRIAQEALNNSLKHAQARNVKLLLRRDGKGAILEVADDGIGFDRSVAREHGGMGLRGMEERAAGFGGRLVVESRPGEGTKIRVEVGTGGAGGTEGTGGAREVSGNVEM